MMRFASTDGVEVAVHDLGGDGEPLLLVHATGFCSGVLAPLASALAAAFHSWAVDLRGHGRTPRPASGDFAWEGFGDDVLAAVDGLGLQRPAAFGHSSGGAALLMAEARRPGTFRELWCYEPIVWPDPEGARTRGERLAEGARRRRPAFTSREEAYSNYASKFPFSVLAPECLRAYVQCGFEDSPDGGIVLRCHPDDEAAIYVAGVTGDRLSQLADVGCPVTVACGADSDAIDPDLARVIVSALPAGRLEVMPALGHFGPLEEPEELAQVLG